MTFHKQPHRWKCFFCKEIKKTFCLDNIKIHVCWGCWSKEQIKISDMVLAKKEKDRKKLLKKMIKIGVKK